MTTIELIPDIKNSSINVNNKSKKINRDENNEDLENNERNFDVVGDDGCGETSNLDKYEVMATGTSNMADTALSQVNKLFFNIFFYDG